MRKIFGTDGVRGLANTYPMTPEIALKLGKAAAVVFRKENGRRHKVVIGKDTRLSGYIFESALTAGLCSMGVDVLLVGPMPTPAIAHLTKSFAADAGIVITASHNPAHDNGIKFFDQDGFKLDDKKEEEIEKLALSADISAEHIKAEKMGKAFRIDDARGRYIEYAKSTIGNMSLQGLNVVLDCAHGAAYTIAPSVLKELGANVQVTGANPDGLNINEKCGATFTDFLVDEIKKNKADAGIALDGDADRVIMVDEKGTVVSGDHIMATLALGMKENNRLKNDTVVVTKYSNLGFKQFMESKGITVLEVENGDRYVIEKLRSLGSNFGGERSGHIINLDFIPTGDGLITALQILSLMKKKKAKLSTLTNTFKDYPQKLIAVNVKSKPALEENIRISSVIDEASKAFGTMGRIFVRYSGTQPVCRVLCEGKDEALTNTLAKKVAKVIKEEIG